MGWLITCANLAGPRCADIQSNVTLGVPVRVSLGEMSTRMCRPSEEGGPPQGVWASSKQLKASIEQEVKARGNSSCLTE